jgi:hypothetical protein
VRLCQLSIECESGHQSLLDCDAVLWAEFVHAFPEFQMHILAIALGFGTVVVFHQELPALEREEEAVLRHTLANTPALVNDTGIGDQFITWTG